MDEPICYWCPSSPPLDQNMQLERTLSQRYYAAVRYDDKDEFFRIIKDPGFEKERSTERVDTIFIHDALEIGIALFNGETKGIIDLEDVLKDGLTLLHFAAHRGAPRLTKYLVERGDNVDVLCDYGGLQQATPFDLVVHYIMTYGERRNTLHDLLFYLCFNVRRKLEVLRLLVRNTPNKEIVREAFVHYAVKGQLAGLGALFLAAPELFLSSYLVSNSLEKRAPTEERLSLLLDVFAVVGDKLVAYVRLQETCGQFDDQTPMEVDFLIHEVARKKIGVSSPEYYFRFFKPLKPKDDQINCSGISLKDLELDEIDPGTWLFSVLPEILMRKDFDQAYIYGLRPVLWPKDVDRLNTAIKEKLSSMPTLKYWHSSMSTLNSCHQDMTKISSKKEENPLPQWLPFRAGKNFEHRVRAFCTSAASANSWLEFKSTPTNTLVNKVVPETKIRSLFYLVKQFHIPMIVKRLIK